MQEFPRVLRPGISLRAGKRNLVRSTDFFGGPLFSFFLFPACWRCKGVSHGCSPRIGCSKARLTMSETPCARFGVSLISKNATVRDCHVPANTLK